MLFFFWFTSEDRFSRPNDANFYIICASFGADAIRGNIETKKKKKKNIFYVRALKMNHLSFESERNEFTFDGDARFETGHWN